MIARLCCQLMLILAVVFSDLPMAVSPAWGQQAAKPAANAPAAEASSKTPKPVNKVYIVGYTLMVLMVGLGVLVICHHRERKARPDLPQDLVAERLRQGTKAPPAQKSG